VRPPGFVFHGTVLGVRRDQRIGWIRPADPRAEFVRFDAAALEGDGFQRLEPGDPVSWWMEKGAKGRIHLVA
jgi:cold shock CspA family protein